MRKITFILLSLFVFVSMQAQVKKAKILPKATLKVEETQKTSGSIELQNTRGLNEKSNGVFWRENFSEGKIPSGWLNVDLNNKGFVWRCTNEAPGGQYSTNIGAINSTSGGSFMQLRGDFYNTPMPAVPINMDAYFQTSAIDCSEKEDVLLSFQHYFRYCCDEDLAHFSVFVSNDSINWIEFDVKNGIGANKVSHDEKNESPLKAKVNITSVASFQPKVWIRWHKYGASHYFWMIDDIELSNVPVNDVQITDYFPEFYGIGYYSKIPKTETQNLFFSTKMYNFGKAEQHNIKLNVNVNDLLSDVYDVNSLSIDTLISDNTDSIAIDSPFVVPATIKTYEVNFNLTQDEKDDIIENNSTSMKFAITDTVYARDVKRTSYTGPARYTDGSDGDMVGTLYYIKTKEELNSISAYISGYSDSLTSLIGKILIDDGSGNLSEILSTDIYTVQGNDIGNWITIPFVKDGTSEFIAGDNIIYACFEFYFKGIGEEGLYVGADESVFHNFQEESLLRIAGQDFYISMVPMIRLNVKATNTPLSAVVTSRTNVTCYGASTGKAVAVGFGGTPPYSFKWNDNSTNDTISNISAGIYTVTITDAKDSISIASVEILQSDSINIDATIKHQGGFQTKDGMITINVTGGNPDYKYLWSNGADYDDIENLLDGTYTLTITDSKTCLKSQSFVVNTSSCLMSSTISSTNILCYGDKIGTASIQNTNEISPVTYIWSNDSTTQNISNLAAGMYKVTVTDSIGCLQFPTIEITQPGKLIPSLAGTNISCHGLTDGSINLTILGGVSPFNILWNDNSTIEDLSNLTEGTYTVVVTDSNLCVSTDSVTIINPEILSSSIEKTDIKCKNTNTGIANLTVSGGTSPFTFLWSNSSTTEDLTNVAASNYKVTITDSRLCTVKDSTTITDIAISPIEVSVVVNGPWIYGNVNTAGTIDITVTGGSSPYTYKWSNNQTTEDITISAKGNYTVSITDAIGCVVTQTSNATAINENPIKSSELSIYPNPTNGNINFTNVENANVTIYNIIGEQVMNVNTQNKNLSLNLSKLANGTYIVRIIKDKNVITEKITLKK